MRTVIALASCLVSPLLCFAAETTAGRWEGTMQVPDFPLHVVVDLDHDASGAWIGSIIIPELKIKGSPLTDIGLRDSAVSFAIKDVLADPQAGPAKFQGQFDANRAIAGNLTQAGNSAKLTLMRTGSAQVDLPARSTAVAADLEGKWVGEYELMGYTRHVTLSLTNHANAAATGEWVIVGKKVNNLPVDLLTQDGAFLRVESHEIGINFEGSFRKDMNEISGTCEQGPFEVPLVLHKETGK